MVVATRQLSPGGRRSGKTAKGSGRTGVPNGGHCRIMQRRVAAAADDARVPRTQYACRNGSGEGWRVGLLVSAEAMGDGLRSVGVGFPN